MIMLLIALLMFSIFCSFIASKTELIALFIDPIMPPTIGSAEQTFPKKPTPTCKSDLQWFLLEAKVSVFITR